MAHVTLILKFNFIQLLKCPLLTNKGSFRNPVTARVVKISIIAMNPLAVANHQNNLPHLRISRELFFSPLCNGFSPRPVILLKYFCFVSASNISITPILQIASVGGMCYSFPSSAAAWIFSHFLQPKRSRANGPLLVFTAGPSSLCYLFSTSLASAHSIYSRP